MTKILLNWKLTFTILSIGLVVVSIFFTEIILISFKTETDINVYCSAVETYENGNNPYLIEKLRKYSNSNLSFIYPPLSLPFFKILCLIDSIAGYYIIWILLLLAIFCITKRADARLDPLLLITLLASGFLVTFWNMLTGNVGLIELTLFAVTYYFITKRKYRNAALFLALTSFFKVLPILFAPLFLFTKEGYKEKFKTFFLITIFLAAANLLSFLLFPNIMPTYLLSLVGKAGQQHSPIYESGGIKNPSLLFFTKELSERFFNSNTTISIIIYLLCTLLVLLLFCIYIKRERRRFLHIFSFGVLAIMIILPRLKPYSFAFALLPTYFLIKNFNFKNKLLAILLTSLLPLLVLIFGFSPHNVNTIWKYNQLISLLAIFIFILLKDFYKRGRKAP